MNASVEKFQGTIITRDQAIIMIKAYQDEAVKVFPTATLAVCFSLEEINKLLNHAAVAFDAKSIAENERGVAFYFVYDGIQPSILMAITHMNDKDSNGHLDPSKGDIFENLITTPTPLVSAVFDLLDVGSKHP